MPTCDKCEDPTDYELYQDQFEHWRLGTQLDINVYREHICKPRLTGPTKYWCFKCGDNGAPIPYSNPCKHRRGIVDIKPKTGLQTFT